MSRRIFSLLLLLAIALGATLVMLLRYADPFSDQLGTACRESGDGQQSHASRPSNWPTNAAGFIAHGGGGIDDKTNTDSVEAVASSISRGYRMIELDLLITTDGFIVAAHDWKSFRQRTGHAPDAITDQPLSLAEFHSRKIDGRYTPLDEEAIRSIFQKRPDLILVTDKIRDFSRLVKAFPFQERVIVEVFSLQEVSRAKVSGVVNPMLSIGNLEASLGLILEQPVRHVALSTGELLRCPGAARKIVESGRSVFAFTSDDASLMESHIGTHVSAFYSDFWHVAHGRCQGAHCPGDRPTVADGH